MISLLDTHQHLIYPDRLGYAWTDDIPVLAKQAFTLDDYAKLTADSDMIGTVFMEAGVDDADFEAETRFIATLAGDASNNIMGIIASCRPEFDEGFDAWIEECASMPVVGFRRILHVVDDEVSRTETFRANVKKLGRRDLTFDMCFLASQLHIAYELASECDDTQMILNHCGVPDVAGGEINAWKTGMSKMGELSHVNCKVSGILAYCAPGTASLATIRPYLDHVVEVFGPERLVWGSDWPVVNLANGIVDWTEITREYLGGYSEAEVKNIAHDNAQRIYRLG